MSRKYRSIRTPVVFLGVVVGCTVVAGCTGADPPQDESTTPFQAAETALFLDPYVACDESVADHVLLVSITLPNVSDAHEFRIPFRKAKPADAMSGGGGGSFCAVGPDGGVSGSIDMESSTETSVSVRIDLFWSLAQANGELKELIEIPIGKAGKKDLSEARRIHWRFVTPKPKNQGD